MTWAVIESKWAEMTRRVCGDWANEIAAAERGQASPSPLASPATEARAPLADHDRVTPAP